MAHRSGTQWVRSGRPGITGPGEVDLYSPLVRVRCRPGPDQASPTAGDTDLLSTKAYSA